MIKVSVVTVPNPNLEAGNYIKHGGQVASVAGMTATPESLREAKIVIKPVNTSPKCHTNGDRLCYPWFSGMIKQCCCG